MCAPQYKRDLIAERDAKQKMARSVVKFWNVNYIMPGFEPTPEVSDIASAPEEENLTPEEAEKIKQAQEIFERLEAERKHDEDMKANEIAQLLAAQDQSNYNATTGSYSGAYGQGDISEEKLGQVNSILSEKKDAVSELIKQLQGN